MPGRGSPRLMCRVSVEELEHFDRAVKSRRTSRQALMRETLGTLLGASAVSAGGGAAQTSGPAVEGVRSPGRASSVPGDGVDAGGVGGAGFVAVGPVSLHRCPAEPCEFTAPSPAARCPVHGRKVVTR